VLRYIGRVLGIREYRNLRELAFEVLVGQKSEYLRMFSLPRSMPDFCRSIRILKKEIHSMVYKTLITQGLFPFHCEINTMNDSYLKLKLLSYFTNSEILPWSPKFHASLAVGD
jgi:hypothetical protein